MYSSVENAVSVLRLWAKQVMYLEGKTWRQTAKEMGIGKKTLYVFLTDAPPYHSNARVSTLLAVEAWCRRFEPIPGGRPGKKKP